MKHPVDHLIQRLYIFGVPGVVNQTRDGQAVILGQVAEHMERAYLVPFVRRIRYAVCYEKNLALAHREIYFLIFGPSQSVPLLGSLCQTFSANFFPGDAMAEGLSLLLVRLLLAFAGTLFSYQ